MSFDRLAPHYRWMEAVLAGGVLHRCRIRWLSEVLNSKRALFIGEGHGRMLEACATALPNCHFTVLDQSAAMLIQAHDRWRRIGGKQTIIFEQADLLAWRSEHSGYDLVMTNFFLDCFTEEQLRRVVVNIRAAVSPKARWLLADFCMPPSGWRRIRAQVVLTLAYNFFRIATDISAKGITSPDETLSTAGFILRRREWFNHGLLHADLWEFRD